MNVQNQWLTKSPPFCLGHRGFPSRARENTQASFAAALVAGAQGVEMDVLVTADGVPVVHHDDTAWTGEALRLITECYGDSSGGSEELHRITHKPGTMVESRRVRW